MASLSNAAQNELLSRVRLGQLDAAIVAVRRFEPPSLRAFLEKVGQGHAISVPCFESCHDAFDMWQRRLPEDLTYELFLKALEERRQRKTVS